MWMNIYVFLTYLSLCVYMYVLYVWYVCCDTCLCDIYVCDLCLCDMYIYCVCVMCMCMMGVCACVKACRPWHIWKCQSITWCGHYLHIWVSFRDKLKLSHLHDKHFYLLAHLTSLPTYFKSRFHIWQKMWYLSLSLLYFA